jgi:hypothetical protein
VPVGFSATGHISPDLESGFAGQINHHARPGGEVILKHRNPRLRFLTEEAAPDGGSNESESASTTAQATGGDEKGSEGKAKAHPEDDLPAWAKDELSRTRREAARYRTERNELRTKLEGAKTPDEVQALVAEYEQKAAAMELDLVRERVARANGLPDELAEVLKGTTEDELKAHAEVLKKFASGTRRQASGTGSGGLDPTKSPEKFDAKAAAQAILARR